MQNCGNAQHGAAAGAIVGGFSPTSLIWKRRRIMFERLVKIICNYVEVEPENIHPESRFMEDLGFTSFDFMSMLGEIEDEFDIEVEQSEVVNIRTVQEAVDYLETLVK